MNYWIGKEINTGGSYESTKYKKLNKRIGTPASPLFYFETEIRYERYYISDMEVIGQIESLLNKPNSNEYELRDYLSNLVISRFGIGWFLANIEKKMAEERERAYKKGKNDARREIWKALEVE